MGVTKILWNHDLRELSFYFYICLRKKNFKLFRKKINLGRNILKTYRSIFSGFVVFFTVQKFRWKGRKIFFLSFFSLLYISNEKVWLSCAIVWIWLRISAHGAFDDCLLFKKFSVTGNSGKFDLESKNWEWKVSLENFLKSVADWTFLLWMGRAELSAEFSAKVLRIIFRKNPFHDQN